MLRKSLNSQESVLELKKQLAKATAKTEKEKGKRAAAEELVGKLESERAWSYAA